jgi:hypothetical protein
MHNWVVIASTGFRCGTLVICTTWLHGCMHPLPSRRHGKKHCSAPRHSGHIWLFSAQGNGYTHQFAARHSGRTHHNTTLHSGCVHLLTFPSSTYFSSHTRSAFTKKKKKKKTKFLVRYAELCIWNGGGHFEQ